MAKSRNERRQRAGERGKIFQSHRIKNFQITSDLNDFSPSISIVTGTVIKNRMKLPLEVVDEIAKHLMAKSDAMQQKLGLRNAKSNIRCHTWNIEWDDEKPLISAKPIKCVRTRDEIMKEKIML